MRLTGKKLLLLGFIAVLLLGIPLTIYILQHQQQTKSHAQKSTTISFDPTSSTSSPIQRAIGDTIPLNIVVSPGTNLVGWIRVVITYDSTKLALVSEQTDNIKPFAINPATAFTFFNGPTYSDGKIVAELSVGADPTKALQNSVTLATITFKALADTGTTPTTVIYSAETQATSLGSTDQANEDVLSSTVPATIAIASGGSVPTATPTGTGGALPTVTTTPQPLGPTTTPTATASSTITPGAGTGGTTNKIPVCTSLSVDRTTTGTSPLSLTFTASGTDSDGVINKVTFDYGDGVPVDVTSAGGIGTNTVAVQNAHTFNNTGSYVAKATLTDDKSGISVVGSCTRTVTVQAAATITSSASANGTPLPPTGPGSFIVIVGVFTGILTILGAILFFAL